jgi:agmatine deiminase
MPAAKFHDGQRLPAGYLNFYIANGVVVVPQFDDPRDAETIAILREHLPDRRIVGIPTLDLIWGFGAFHCLSQQEPA